MSREIPGGGAMGGGAYGSPPPDLPPKKSSGSFREKEKLLGGKISSDKPKPKPRTRVSGRVSLSPTLTSPTLTSDQPRPVPRPRPRTMSKEKVFSEEFETKVLETSLDEMKPFETNLNDRKSLETNLDSPKAFETNFNDSKAFETNFNDHKAFETNLDGFKLPPDADEAERMVEDMIHAKYDPPKAKLDPPKAKFDPPKPVDTNPIYECEEFLGSRQPKQPIVAPVLQPSVLQPNVLKQDVLKPGLTGSGLIIGDSQDPHSDEIYSNFESIIGFSRSEPDGATEPVDNMDSVYQVIGPDTSKFQNSFGRHFQVKQESSNAYSDQGIGDYEDDDESTYAPIWVGDANKPPVLPVKKSAAQERVKYMDPANLTFLPGKSSNVVQVFESESSTDDMIPKLNITETDGEYVGLDPAASLIYEQPPPLQPPPPLPSNIQKANAPPIPPRPCPAPERPSTPESPFTSGRPERPATPERPFTSGRPEYPSTPGRPFGSGRPERPSTPERPATSGRPDRPPLLQSPSEVFDKLQTLRPGVFVNDDPFQGTDFASTCNDFNKSGEQAQDPWPGASASGFAQPEQDPFDPFGLGIHHPSGGSTSSKSSGSSQWASGGSLSRISLSHVPPPPNPEDMYTKVVKAQEPREDFYSLGQEIDAGLDSSDSSEELFAHNPSIQHNILVDQPRLSDASSNMSSMSGGSGSLPIVPGPQQKKIERFGYLWKQGGERANRGWRKRWVVFNGRDLRYYVSNRSQISKRVIPLRCMKKVETDVKEGDSNRFKFRLFTTLKDRVFLFGAEKLEDCITWASTLMAAISQNEKNNNAVEGSDDILDETPDKVGYIKFENGGGKRYYVCIRGSVLCYYNSIQDFQMCSPVHEINMELASVKNVAKCKLQLTTHYAYFVLGFENPTDAEQWKMAMEDAIAEGLADDSVLQKVYENDNNRLCADCEAQDPHWASINLGIVVCKKCAGIHRMFEAKISKIRSLRMDTKVWTPSLIELMKAIGNGNANEFWEFDLLPDDKISHESSMEVRKEFISNKYKDRKYIKVAQASQERTLLHEELLRVSATDDLMELMKLLFSGADIRYHRHGCIDETAYLIAKREGKRLLMEFLYQNGGDGSTFDTEDEGRLREDVRQEGYLLKTGPRQNGFEKRWCVLEHGALSYYLNEHCTTAKDSIEGRAIHSISETSLGKQNYSFEISTKKGSNRVYLFAAEDAGTRGMWLRQIGKVVCPVAIMEHVGMIDFSFAGNFHVRELGTTEWRKTWLMISWRMLQYMDQNNKLEMIDLRKAQSIKFQGSDTGCGQCEETGQHFVINAPDKALYIQADLVRDTEKAFTACEQAMQLSGKTLQDQQLTSDDVPVIVDRCINAINLKGMDSVGIYRQSATNSRIHTLLDELRKDARGVKMEDYSCDEVANALKRFFRELDDSLFTRDSYTQWIETADIRDVHHKLQWYTYLLEKLPQVNKNTLKKLLLHLNAVIQHNSENKMTRENLATCFAPSLFGSESKNSGGGSIGGILALEMHVLMDIIHHQQDILPSHDKHQIIENKISEAAAVISQITDNSKRMSTVVNNIITPVYMYRGDGAEITLPIGMNDKAEHVIKNIKEKNKITGEFALTEILLDDLERLIPLDEAVLPIITGWGTLGDGVCSNAKLCLRRLDFLQKLQDALDQQGIFGELKYCSDKKKFNKTAFQLKQGKLVCYKDLKGRNIHTSWNVEDLILYLGIDPRRQSGKSSSGLTFVVKGEKCNKDWFGKSLLFGSEADKMRWASALLVAQYPEGIFSTFS